MGGVCRVKHLFATCLIVALLYLTFYLLEPDSPNQTSVQRNNLACASSSLGRWTCHTRIYDNHNNDNTKNGTGRAENSGILFQKAFSNSKTLMDFVKSENSTSELNRLVKVIQNRRGLPNYFMQNMTSEKSKNYTSSNVVFVHHKKAGGTTTKSILKKIHQNLRIPSVPVFFNNSTKVFETYEAKGGTTERTIFVGGFTFGICDVLHWRPCSYMTVNRDPYERVISSYFFCQQNHAPLCGPVIAQNVSIVPWAIHQGSFFFRQLLRHKDSCRRGPNTMRYVKDYLERTKDTITYDTSGRDLCWFRQKAFLQETLTKDFRRAILDYCLDNLHKWFAVLGTLEEYDISVQLFEATFGLPFKKFYSAPENTGRIRAKVDEEIEMKMRAELHSSPEVEEALHEDIMIYKKTKQIMKFQKSVFSSLKNETQREGR